MGCADGIHILTIELIPAVISLSTSCVMEARDHVMTD